MTITLDIRPEVQAELARQAAARGSALEAYAASLLEEAAQVPAHVPTTDPAQGRFDNLSDLLLHSPFAGASLNLDRPKDQPRTVDLR